MSSRACLPPGSLGVDYELAVASVGDLALERPEHLHLGLALFDPAVEVDPAGRVGLADLADGRHVDGVVQLAVATLGEAVDNLSPLRTARSGRCRCRRRTGPDWRTGERRPCSR